MAAAPAPEATILMSASALPFRSSPLVMAAATMIVLIVVEHRNLHPGLQLLLDLEALRALDVLKVDPAERRLQRRNRFHHALDGVGCYFDIEHVDAGELLEQDRLAFHHRLGRERADIAETEHGRAVRHHRDQIGPPGERRRFRRVGNDLLAGRGHPRGISQRQVALVGERLGGLDFELAGPRVAVERQRGGAEILGIRHDIRSPQLGSACWRSGFDIGAQPAAGFEYNCQIQSLTSNLPALPRFRHSQKRQRKADAMPESNR
jgi:hypothetical protein